MKVSSVHASRGGRRLRGINRPTSARGVLAAERSRKAVELKRAGWGLPAIARELGVCKSAAHKALRRGLKAHHDAMAEEAKLFVAQEVARLDRLQAAWWAKALTGDAAAAAVVIRCIRARSSLLGLQHVDWSSRERKEIRQATAPKDPVSGPAASLREAVEILNGAAGRGG